MKSLYQSDGCLVGMGIYFLLYKKFRFLQSKNPPGDRTAAERQSVASDTAAGGAFRQAKCFFYSIRNFVSYRAKTLRGIALRRKGNQSQATPPQAEYFVKRNTFFITIIDGEQAGKKHIQMKKRKWGETAMSGERKKEYRIERIFMGKKSCQCAVEELLYIRKNTETSIERRIR